MRHPARAGPGTVAWVRPPGRSPGARPGAGPGPQLQRRAARRPDAASTVAADCPGGPVKCAEPRLAPPPRARHGRRGAALDSGPARAPGGARRVWETSGCSAGAAGATAPARRKAPRRSGARRTASAAHGVWETSGTGPQARPARPRRRAARRGAKRAERAPRPTECGHTSGTGPQARREPRHAPARRKAREPLRGTSPQGPAAHNQCATETGQIPCRRHRGCALQAPPTSPRPSPPRRG